MLPKVFLISLDKAVSLMKTVFRALSSEGYENGLTGVQPQVLYQMHSRLGYLSAGINAGQSLKYTLNTSLMGC